VFWVPGLVDIVVMGEWGEGEHASGMMSDVLILFLALPLGARTFECVCTSEVVWNLVGQCVGSCRNFAQGSM
jgi:hypothetical protein